MRTRTQLQRGNALTNRQLRVRQQRVGSEARPCRIPCRESRLDGGERRHAHDIAATTDAEVRTEGALSRNASMYAASRLRVYVCMSVSGECEIPARIDARTSFMKAWSWASRVAMATYSPPV